MSALDDFLQLTESDIYGRDIDIDSWEGLACKLQGVIYELDARVKALEDAKIFVDYGTGSQCKYCGTAEYPKGSGRGAHHSASCPVVQAQEKLTKPALAPDLETLVEKYFGQLTKATFDINVPVMQAFKDILRAFAAELVVK
jgi:hypothetical protein